MKTIIKFSLAFVMIFVSSLAMAQTAVKQIDKQKEAKMKTYIIEREIPGASNLSQAQLKAISQTSCGVLKEMGPTIQWIHSYVAGDKIYCIYKAENEELIREHAKKGGFPANKITEVATIISEETARN
jgi:hypothetical protein